MRILRLFFRQDRCANLTIPYPSWVQHSIQNEPDNTDRLIALTENLSKEDALNAFMGAGFLDKNAHFSNPMNFLKPVSPFEI